MGSTQKQIEQFLKRNRDGPLVVVVGFASAFGLRWLNERTGHRDVSLLIGDVETGFRNFTEDDRKSAVEFLRRPDVQVRQCSTLHAKAWLVQSDPAVPAAGAVLVGSANLTKQGLLHNVEMLSVAPESEHARLYAEMHSAFRSSWDIGDSLLVRLGEEPTSPWNGPAAAGTVEPRRNRKAPSGRLQLLFALLLLILVVAALALLVPRVIDEVLTTDPDLPAVLAPESSTAQSPVPQPTTSATSSLEATTVPSLSDQPSSDDPSDGTELGDGLDTAAGLSDQPPSDAPISEAPVPEAASSACPYLTVDSEDACLLLEGLHGVDLTPCEALPIEARPLRLNGEANPARYQPPSYSPSLVCTWMATGTYIAGETIPAGDLRSLNSTVYGTGACQFAVHDDEGEIIISRDSYSHYWVSHTLIRLQPGDEITTSGCGWVPAQAAGLDPGPVLSSQTVGDYPLLVGTDLTPGAVRVECPFRVWPVTEPPDGRDWNAALNQTAAQAHPAGPHEAREGLIRLDC